MGQIKEHYLYDCEVQAFYADTYRVDDEPGSDAYHQELHDSHAVAMWDKIDELERKLDCVRDRLNIDAQIRIQDEIQDMKIIVATMRRIMPALD